MDSELNRKIDLFVANRQGAGETFILEYGLNCLISSLILTGTDKTFDEDRMKEVKKLLVSKTSALSSFRVTAEVAVLSKLAAQNNPEGYLDDVLEVYKVVRGKRVLEYYSYVFAAMTIVDLGRKNEAEKIVAKTEEILNRMKKLHPFLTDENDYAYVALLAMTNKSVDQIIDEMEECYEYFKKDLKIKADSNSIQSLCELIVLSEGNLKEKCDKASELFTAFKDHGARYGSYYEFASLGALIVLDCDTDKLVDTIIEVADTLKQNKGFGSWTLDNKQRLMFAAMLVAQVMSTNDNVLYDYGVNSAVLNNTVAAIIAEEIATMICVATIISYNNAAT